MSLHRALYTWGTSYVSRVCPPVVLDRRLVPYEPEKSQRLSTGLCTHWAPHMSQRPTTLCPPVVLDRQLVSNEVEESHRLSTGLCTHEAPHMSQYSTSLCPCSGLRQTARPKSAGGKPPSIHRALYTWGTPYKQLLDHTLPISSLGQTARPK